MSNFKLDKIKDAIESIKKGEIIIVVDDENRENEGDFITAAETINADKINFMAKYGRGLICVPMSENLCKNLGLEKMVPNNTDPLETAFTVSVDLKGNGVTSGISALDRAKTVKALVDSNTKPDDLQRPGHVFPLIAKEGGVLRRTGHTEAAIDFARLAGYQSAGVIVEIMNDDGSMSRLPELFKVAKKFNLKIVSIEDLIAYRMKQDSLIEKIFDENIKTSFGEYRLRAFNQKNNNQVHIALSLGNWSNDKTVLTRVNSSMSDYEITKILKGHNELKHDEVFKKINSEGKGAILFINQNQTPKNIIDRLKSLIEPSVKPEIDFRDFGIGAQILHEIGISKINLLTNSKQKPRIGLSGYGLSIEKYTRY
jgi:3,4-dihydroxy 2-butanone 4-phosphate synthase/GTP cyclohydrolase II